MKCTFKDDYTEVYENEITIVVIQLCNSVRNYWSVAAKDKGGKMHTVATRCTYIRAKQMVRELLCEC